MSKKIDDTFSLRIRGFTPETLPMSKLAEYLKDFASMLGHESNVHFKGVRKGSAVLRAIVDEAYANDSFRDIALLNQGEAPERVRKAYESINELLKRDSATATLKYKSGNILEFPGKKSKVETKIGPIRDNCQLEGELIRIGGADDSIHMTLQTNSGEKLNLSTKSKELAVNMAQHLFKQLRVEGVGIWYRTEKSGWTLENLKVDSFSVIEDCDLSGLILELQSVEGSQWTESEDPVGDARKIRSS